MSVDPNAVTVSVTLTATDFERLSPVSMDWAANEGWRQQVLAGRFIPYEQGERVRFTYKFAYWFEDWTSVVLARSYLLAIGEGFQIIDDESTGEHVIITDFSVLARRGRDAH